MRHILVGISVVGWLATRASAAYNASAFPSCVNNCILETMNNHNVTAMCPSAVQDVECLCSSGYFGNLLLDCAGLACTWKASSYLDVLCPDGINTGTARPLFPSATSSVPASSTTHMSAPARSSKASTSAASTGSAFKGYGPNVYVVVGAAIGSLVGLAALIALMWFLMKRRRQRQRPPVEEGFVVDHDAPEAQAFLSDAKEPDSPIHEHMPLLYEEVPKTSRIGAAAAALFPAPPATRSGSGKTAPSAAASSSHPRSPPSAVSEKTVGAAGAGANANAPEAGSSSQTPFASSSREMAPGAQEEDAGQIMPEEGPTVPPAYNPAWRS